MTAAHGFKPAFGHTEPRRGAEWWGEAFLVTFGALPKVTRCKSGTIRGRYHNNGYVLRPDISSARYIAIAGKPTVESGHTQQALLLQQHPPRTAAVRSTKNLTAAN